MEYLSECPPGAWDTVAGCTMGPECDRVTAGPEASTARGAVLVVRAGSPLAGGSVE